MATQYFYVTRIPGHDFVATLSLSEIRTRLATGELQDSFHATESDGRSFALFQRGGGSGRWRTLAELLTESPREAGPKPPSPSHWLSGYFLGGDISWLFLVVGQVAAILTCIVIPIVVFGQLAQLVEAEHLLERAGRLGDRRAGDAATGLVLARIMIVVLGILAFCLSAAMCVVFKRARSMAQIAADQDAENQRLWHAIAALPTPGNSPPEEQLG